MAISIANNILRFRARFEASRFRQFIQWWVSELRDLLPGEMREKIWHAQRRALLSISGDQLTIEVLEADSRQEIEVLSLQKDPLLQKQEISSLLTERELKDVPRILILPGHRVLRKTLQLPIAAESDLRSALSFEMDRQTPFKASEVFFDFRLLSRDKENSQLNLELLVSPKDSLSREWEQLAALGLDPSAADVLDEALPAGFNLLPLDLRHRVVNAKSRFNLVLAAVAVTLLALVMLQTIWLKQHQIAEVQRAIDEVKQEAFSVQRIREQIAEANIEANFLKDRRAAAVPTVMVLSEISRILPDDTFLDRLLLGSDSIQIQGKSVNAQRLIEIVNGSDYFRDASFRGPTRLDSQSQKEIFDINANLIVQVKP